MRYFTLKEQLSDTLLDKLGDPDWNERRYVVKCFMAQLPFVLTKPWDIWVAVSSLSEAIRGSDSDIRGAVVSCVKKGIPQILRSAL